MGEFIAKIKHAFAVGPENPVDDSPLPQALERLAQGVVDRGLETMAIVFLESIRPLNFMTSQAMWAVWPVLEAAGAGNDFAQVAQALEDRRTIDRLIRRIEELAAR